MYDEYLDQMYKETKSGMSVKELIEILSQMNPEAEIVISSNDVDDSYKPVERIELEVGNKLGEENFVGIIYNKEN
ncbi:hypothetical protein IRP62_11445 (plasmid) [Clostridium botulinum]|uniref:hypothetical protein n=1 Tax=Clostridium botulinum C phage TaxID=12336 RepID=UPI00005DB50D|nr:MULTISPECIES: hypothetical protein [Clostridium]YP_398493.1 hypothetical protein CST063 [Clostridium phage c-st]MCD3245383.1 hypothetical protein [Clostridium botulinum C]MCD3261762.1 hypothetical protein [Clostridium botulinum C]QPW54408.1 hypothetical protein IRP62_11445 [Clostridium botulinum]QPW56539.1 hypothetical protein IRP61_10830 [Clostridium botulinum]CAG7840049.1 hypothetical protein CLOHAE12215_01465 [Clostridium haemolyticum]